MSTIKPVSAAILLAAALGLGGCATSNDSASTGASGATCARHSHMRDAKQVAEPCFYGSEEHVRKPLHDHRDWK